MFLISSWRNK